MRPLHFLLALAVVFIWGTNFVVIKWALAEFPPFLLATLRFALCVLSGIFFIARPAVTWKALAQFGVLLGAGQFGLLFFAMRSDITPGLASLLMQSQVFFTIGLAMTLQGERVLRAQVLAMALAAAGIVVIGWQAVAPGGDSITMFGLTLVLAAAACWAMANQVARGAGRVNALAFIVWSSPFSLPPLALLALLFDEWPAITQSLTHASWAGWAAVVWQAAGNTLFGFAAWNWLLARYPAMTVTPLALLVPVFGMAASAWVLGEPLQAWKLIAAGLVIGGLALNLVASRMSVPRPPARSAA